MIIDDTDDESVASFHVISDTYEEEVKVENCDVKDCNDNDREDVDEDKIGFEDDDGDEVIDDGGKSGMFFY